MKHLLVLVLSALTASVDFCTALHSRPPSCSEGSLSGLPRDRRHFGSSPKTKLLSLSSEL